MNLRLVVYVRSSGVSCCEERRSWERRSDREWGRDWLTIGVAHDYWHWWWILRLSVDVVCGVGISQ